MAVVACAGCGAKNRVEDRGPGVRPVCGRCGLILPEAISKPIELTDSSFAQVLASAGSRPVLVDCWAPWCAPCRALTPIIELLAAEAHGRWVIAKLNVDQNPATSARFEIGTIPTLLVFKHGKLVDTLAGAHRKGAIEALLLRHV